jgi:hypothetical protein
VGRICLLVLQGGQDWPLAVESVCQSPVQLEHALGNSEFRKTGRHNSRHTSKNGGSDYKGVLNEQVCPLPWSWEV